MKYLSMDVLQATNINQNEMIYYDRLKTVI